MSQSLGFVSAFLETRPEADFTALAVGVPTKGAISTVQSLAFYGNLATVPATLKGRYALVNGDTATLKVFVNGLEVTDATVTGAAAGSALTGEVALQPGDTVQIEIENTGVGAANYTEIRLGISV